MRLGKKKHWITLLAALLLSSKVVAAVQWCAHDVVFHQSQSRSMSGHAHHVAATEDCCDAQQQKAPDSGDPDDCCATWTVEHRNVPKHCICGGALAVASIDFSPATPVFYEAASFLPLSVPIRGGPSLNILYRNFRT